MDLSAYRFLLFHFSAQLSIRFKWIRRAREVSTGSELDGRRCRCTVSIVNQNKIKIKKPLLLFLFPMTKDRPSVHVYINIIIFIYVACVTCIRGGPGRIELGSVCVHGRI